ncbi:MAG: hypothetical protein WDO18_01095 [Acidobacteriota bacterium]
MNLVSTLEAGRRELADAVSEAGEGARAASGWTVAECVEHVAIAEVRYLKWLEHARGHYGSAGCGSGAEIVHHDSESADED